MRKLLQRIARLPGTAAEPGSAVLSSPDAVARLEQILPVLRQRVGDAYGAEATARCRACCPAIVRLAGLLTMMHWARLTAAGCAPADAVPDDVTAQRLEDARLRAVGRLFPPPCRGVFQRAPERAIAIARLAAPRAGCDAPDSIRRSREVHHRRRRSARRLNAEGAEQVIARLETGGVLCRSPPQAVGSRGPLRRHAGRSESRCSATKLRS